ncbi:Acyl-coenzyme A thioesterase 13 [Escovopsis weberi]|uniref:Acyl-coenzyme A thioesterase 13 n=1 Tax=Escovopsis weberi TaxID=150374 RepID=A0A0M9VSQ5_ESCWE|nr:Acyl-coenzyme A thioesterase 13 [Escovopsis weberi]
MAKAPQDVNQKVIDKINFHLTNEDERKNPVAGGWMKTLLPHIKLVSVDPSLPHPRVVFSFTTQASFSNRFHNLHGGAMATLFDFCTTMPLFLVNKPGFWQTLGVSRTLNVTYLRPVAAGTETLIECDILQIGRKICALRGVLRRKADGQVLAVCEHNKVNVDPEAKL